MHENYATRIKAFNQDLNTHTATSKYLGAGRLLVFILMVGSGYFFWGYTIPLSIGMLLGAILFLKLVRLSAKADMQIQVCKALITINTNEVLAYKGEYQNPEDGAGFDMRNHEYAQDLDLFGPRSFFSTFNRTVTFNGSAQLAKWITHPVLDKGPIESRQEAIKELTDILDWRHLFLAHGMTHTLDQSETQRIQIWLANKNENRSGYGHKIALFTIPILTLSFLISAIMGLISWTALAWILCIPLAYVGRFIKYINGEYRAVSHLVPQLEICSVLIQYIEDHTFNSELLSQWKNDLFDENQIKASDKVTELKRILSKFEQRGNILIGILLNAFFVWDLQQVYRIRIWKNKNAKTFNQWLTVIANFDALISLANMAYNHRGLNYPDISRLDYEVEGRGIKHPMLNDKSAVGNDFYLSRMGSIDIITGANMAGKSTFLRTIGLNMVLGMMGCPVAAVYFKFSPMMVFSSMRTQDSLAEHTSFFHAELSRLAQISDILKSGGKRFVILDEILKGTNSRDKALGSYAFVEKMTHYNMMGLIATHDLSLCKLEEKYPDKIHNKSFEVDFDDDELTFDYILQNRVCKNMNASFLLKKMGIIDHY